MERSSYLMEIWPMERSSYLFDKSLCSCPLGTLSVHISHVLFLATHIYIPTKHDPPGDVYIPMKSNPQLYTTIHKHMEISRNRYKYIHTYTTIYK